MSSDPIPSALPESSRTITAGPTPAYSNSQVSVSITDLHDTMPHNIYLNNEGAHRLERRLRRLRKGPRPVRSQNGAREVKVQAGTPGSSVPTGMVDVFVESTIPNDRQYGTSPKAGLTPKQARRLAKALRRAADEAEQAQP